MTFRPLRWSALALVLCLPLLTMQIAWADGECDAVNTKNTEVVAKECCCTVAAIGKEGGVSDAEQLFVQTKEKVMGDFATRESELMKKAMEMVTAAEDRAADKLNYIAIFLTVMGLITGGSVWGLKEDIKKQAGEQIKEMFSDGGEGAKSFQAQIENATKKINEELQKSLETMQKFDGRLGALEKAIDQNENKSSSVQTGKNAAELFAKALQAARQGLSDRALENYQAVLNIDEKNTPALNNMGVIYYSLNRYDDALHKYEEALSIKKDDPDIWNNKANVLVKLERIDEALEAHKIAVHLAPKDAIILNNYANTLGRAAKYDEALRYHDLALKSANEKDKEKLTCNKANTLMVIRRYAEALDLYEDVIQKEPDSIIALLGKADALLLGMGNPAEALKIYERLLQMSKEKQRSDILHHRRSRITYNLACAYALLGREADTEQALRQAISLRAAYKIEAFKDDDFKVYRDKPWFKELTKE